MGKKRVDVAAPGDGAEDAADAARREAEDAARREAEVGRWGREAAARSRAEAEARALIEAADRKRRSHTEPDKYPSGRLLRAARERRVARRGEAAARCGITEFHLAAIELGYKEPRWTLLLKFLSGLGVDPREAFPPVAVVPPDPALPAGGAWTRAKAGKYPSGRFLRAARERRVAVRGEAAARCGIHEYHLAALELGTKEPRWTVLLKFLSGLGVDPREAFPPIPLVPPDPAPAAGQ